MEHGSIAGALGWSAAETPYGGEAHQAQVVPVNWGTPGCHPHTLVAGQLAGGWWEACRPPLVAQQSHVPWPAQAVAHAASRVPCSHTSFARSHSGTAAT